MNDRHPELVGPDHPGSGSRNLAHHRGTDHATSLSFYTGGYEGGDDHAPQPGGVRRGLNLRDVLIQAFYNRRMIRNCVLGGLGLGLVAAGLAHTQYTADSLLLMMNGSGQTAAGGDLAGGGAAIGQLDAMKALQSEVQILQSEDVLRHAVEKAGADGMFPAVGARRMLGMLPPADPVRQEAAAVHILRSNLRVSAEAGTNVIRVALESPNREQSIQAVKAVVDSYLERRRSLYASGSTTTLGGEIAKVSGQLHDVEQQIQTVRDQYGVLDISQDVALASNRLDGVAQRQNQVRERQTTVHAEMIAAERRLGSMPQQVFDSRETSNQAANDDTRNTLLRLQQDREHMAAQYAANWPALKELDQKIASVRQQISSTSHGTFFTSRSTRNPVYDQMAGRLATLQVEDQSLGKQLTELDTQYKQAEQRVRELRDADSKLHDLSRSREVAENIYKQLSLKQAGSQVRDSVVNAGEADVRVAQPADAPLSGHSQAITYLAAGLMLGLISAIAASVIATLIRQVYIAPGEAERDLDMPSLVDFDVEASDFESRSGRRQVCNLAAFLLDVNVDGRPLSVIQVVAATEADGKTALVRALATELAQGHGMRTLILDLHSDGRAEANALGGSDSRHLSVLETDMPVVATDVPQLWVSVDAAQSSLGNARTLISRSREMLEGLRQRFDMVLIISPPDVGDYSARRLSSLVDANLMVIRSEHTRAPVALQLRDSILAAGGNLLGFAYTWRRYHIPQAIYRWL